MLADFDDALTRYVADTPSRKRHNRHKTENIDENGHSTNATNRSCGVSETELFPNIISGVAVVADNYPPPDAQGDSGDDDGAYEAVI